MLKNLFKVVIRNSSAAMALIIAIVLPIAYNNCSAKMGFEASTESRLESLNTSGAIVINDGDEFTKASDVRLSITHASADKMYVTNDPKCETGGSWEPIAGIKSWTLSTLNTSAAVYAKFSNDGVLASDCLQDSIIHDDIAPTLSVTSEPAAYTNASEVSASLASSDSGSGLDGASCAGTGTSTSKTCTPSSLVLSSPAEGPHSYSITVKDRAGNVSLPRTVDFVVDRTVPTVALNLTPSRVTNQVSSEFRFSGNDTLSGIERYECRAGASATFSSRTFQTCVSGVSNSLQSGLNRFEVRSIDRAGNVSSVVGYDWTIDQGAPTVTITRAPGVYSNQTQGVFEFVGSDDSGPITSYSCRVDTDAAVSCSSPFTTRAGLSQGSHTFSVTGTDGAGNVSAPATYTWTVDTVLPVVTIVSHPSAVTNMTSADFVLSATDSNGIEAIECQIDGGGYQPCTTTVNYPTLAAGNRRFDTRARDRAGNVSAVATYSWAIDTSKPTLAITSGPAAWVNVRAATIALDARDVNAATGLPALRLECRLNSGNFAACTSPATYSSLNAGNYVFIARAIDAAGNISDEASWSWGVDLTPPAINFGKQPLSLLYRGEVSEIAFAVTDATAGVNTVQCGINGTLAACTPSYTNNFLNLPAGNYTFNVVATDRAGNEATGQVTWQISDRLREVIQTVDVKTSSKLDVLVVIDNSGSMANEHRNMAARFGTFLDQLQGTDWQVGIVTTDVDSDAVKKDGRLVEFKNATGAATGQYVITSAMGLQNAKDWFAATIQMSTEGSGNEQGVAASNRALQRARQTGDPISLRNAALIRSDAALAILVVTDADETNPRGTQTQNRPETLINYVRSNWPNKPFSFHSIIVPLNDTVCLGQDGNESYGRTYISASNLTGGNVGTVCATDYGTQLRDIGRSTQELVLSVVLQCRPVDMNADGRPDMTIVTSNGSPAPAYTFESDRIRFATTLPAGMTRLTYNCVAPL